MRFGKARLQSVNGTKLNVKGILANEILLVQVLGADKTLFFGLEIGTYSCRLRLIFGVVDSDQPRTRRNRMTAVTSSETLPTSTGTALTGKPAGFGA